MESEMEFAIMSSTKGKELFDQVARSINLKEVWYFGLQYKDAKGDISWLKLDKKVLKQVPHKDKEQIACLHFLAKFYPEDVYDDIIQTTTTVKTFNFLLQIL